MNANYIYNVQYSEEAAAIAYVEGNNAADAKGMSEKNQTYLTNINAAISGAIIQQGGQEDDALPLTHIRMKTSYPGVLIGTGSAHETGAKNEMLLGFTLDYVTGIPYLPGSSLKGLLRSAFHFGDSEKNETEYVRETLSTIVGNEVSKENVTDLETALFADPDNGIVFLDSFIQGMTTDAGENAAYMGLDYITPHKGDMLKNPIPLPILRINPNVVFDFRFYLQDVKTEDGKVFQVDTIKNLFIEILKDFGIGAKTHVGYGVLEEYKPQEINVDSIVSGKVESFGAGNSGLNIDLGNGKKGYVNKKDALENKNDDLTLKFSIGERIKAKVKEIKESGKIILTMKDMGGDK